MGLKIIENEKGFKVLKLRLNQIFEAFGSVGICDSCGCSSFTNEGFGGYYIAVLNSVYCERCFNDWIDGAKYYPEDARIENNNFNTVYNILENGK